MLLPFRLCLVCALISLRTVGVDCRFHRYNYCVFDNQIINDDARIATLISESDYIFTGKIVSDVIKHNVNYLQFDVQVKRYFKQSPVSLSNKFFNVIFVNNDFGRTNCVPKVKIKDNAIFFGKKYLEASRNLTLKLVLHPVQLTLNNLAKIDEAVKDIHHKPRPLVIQVLDSEPCDKTYCAWGAECIAGPNRRPHCQCPSSCPEFNSNGTYSNMEHRLIPIEVCGTDNVTYSSQCHLRKSSCQRKVNVRVQHTGACERGNSSESSDTTTTTEIALNTEQDNTDAYALTSLVLPIPTTLKFNNPTNETEITDPCRGKQCEYGARCVASTDGRTASCQCPKQCPSYGDHTASRPVCGSNGNDYKDKCELRKHACATNTDISVKFEGKCDPCSEISCPEPEICQLDKDRSPVCRCSDTCSLEFTPVCGSDGKTYSNECTLKQEACRTRKQLRIIYRGKCSSGTNPCASVHCTLGEECTINKYGIARCECPPDCEPIMRPVCSKDGRTFPSECEMRRAACSSRTKIEIAYTGICDKMGPCSDHHCRYGAQCIERDGTALCECPTCPTEFQPVCGSDGISYSNECKLRLEACNHKRDISVLYDGPCNGCENKKCEFYSTCETDGSSEAQCMCPKPCKNQENDPVCGSDKNTYENECELKMTSCQTKQLITVAYRGSCDLCKSVECKFGAHCKAGECVCPTDCSSSGVENVCASNMVTFTNECELKKASCLLPPEAPPLNVIFYGDCRERFAIMDPLALTTPSSMLNNARFGTKQDLQIIEDISNGIVDIESKKHEACRDIHCDFEATCELGPDNFPRCSCRFDCTSAEVLSTNKPVCASDLRIYPSLCAMKMEACQRQEELRLRPLDLCQGMEVKPCNGEMPLIDPVSRIELDCGSGPNRQDCPSGSYCHQTTRFARCCQKKGSIYENSCEDSWYGCCPDGKTPAQGPEHAGCPSQCNCHRLGSFDDTCDPDTGQCHCRPGVGGLKCDRCEPGYWGLPKISSGHRGCLPCGCSTFGSVRDDCEQMTGRCVCKPDIQGQKCTVCTSHDKVLGPNGCIAVDHTTPPPSTCKELNCHFGAICTDRKGLAICECHSECANETPGSKVVCGSDGQTYGSECQLKLVACRHQKDIVVYAFGPCKDEMFPGTDWPIGRYTPQEFTQPDEQHSILSKSTRHLMMPDSRYYYSRASHDSSSTDKWEHKGSKETNFITDINFNGHAAYRPTPATVRVLTALLGDICTNNSDCAIPNSICIGGACTCEEGFVETLDRQECLAHSVPITTEEFRACTSSPCHGDSTCIDLPSATFTCVCNSNYTGMLCDQEISVKYYDVPSFDGKSLMRLKTVRAYHKLNMEIEFKSYNTEGIIFYNQQKVDGTGDFFSLAIINGFVEFRYNLGNGVVKIVSLETIAPLKFHRITLKRYQKDGMLKLDDGEDVTGQSPGKLRALDLEDNAYMGGIPSNYSRIFKNIGTSKWFVGCIRKLKINHKIIDMHLGQDETVISAERVQECGSNPCLSGPCLNGGTCNTINAQQYACVCPERFEGRICENPVNACNFFPCKHGSTCEPLANGKFHCKCIPGTYGFTCEEIETTSTNLIVPEFNGTTFLEYSKILGAGKTFSIEIWFLTYAPNGLLLYTGQHKTGSGDFVSLNLANQHVQFRFNLGSGICNITSKETVTLNKWYQLKVHRRERDGSLQLNNGTIIFARSGPPLTELNLELPVYIAAVPNSSEVHRLSGVSKGLRGAIQHLSINGKEYPILKEKSLCVPDLRYTNYNCRRIKLRKYKGLPCSESRNPCKNGGTCIPMLNDYVCQCKDTFGNHCETVGDNFKYSIKFDGRTFLQYRNRRMRLINNTTNVFSEDDNYSDLIEEDIEDYDLEGDLLPQYDSYENLEDDDKYFDTIGKRGGERGNNYEISFRTFETDSLLMWRSKTRSLNNHYLAVAIVGGYPEFSFNLGKKLDFWSIRFPKQVNDGAWHTVHVRRQKRVGFISVDGEDPVKGISWPGAITFNAHPRLWIGGYSALPHGLPQSYYSGFRGCIQYVKVNKRSLDLLKDKSFRPQFCHENEV